MKARPISDIESLVHGSEKLTDVFGYWPSFQDAEVVEVRLWRGDTELDKDRFSIPVLMVKLRLWEMADDSDIEGFVIVRHPILTTLRFDGLEEDFKLEGFNHQNGIADLLISQHEREDGLSPYFKVEFLSSFGMDASFSCHQVSVLSVVPFTEENAGL